MNNKKILFFNIKYLCYKSNEVFINELTPELEKHGYSVEVCDIAEIEDSDAILEKYIGEHYSAVIDFNSLLPRATLENGEHYADKIDAPYINYIVDHPLFHHVSLKEHLNNYNVICIDDNHRKYIEEYYPHVKNTTVISIPGTQADTIIPFEERRIDLLFPGSYKPVKAVVADIARQPAKQQRQITDLIEMMKADNSLTFEQALKTYHSDHNIQLDIVRFRQTMTDLHLVDVYLRYYYRERVVRSITEAGVRINVCGDNWEMFDFPGKDYLHIEKDVPYLVCQQYFQNAKCVLNVSPGFKAGIHDRVPSAMINGALSITDDSSMLARVFHSGNDVISYKTEKSDIEVLGEKVKELLKDEQKLSNIALQGHITASSNLNWQTQADKLINFIENID